MSYLLNTSIICELVKAKPTPSVVQWINSLDASLFYISVITLGEIRKGVDGIKDKQRHEKIVQWLEHDLPNYFGNRILVIDNHVADMWGRMQSKTKGHSLPAIDGLIAATAEVYQLKLVTRNTKDFAKTTIELINPFTESGV